MHIVPIVIFMTGAAALAVLSVITGRFNARIDYLQQAIMAPRRYGRFLVAPVNEPTDEEISQRKGKFKQEQQKVAMLRTIAQLVTSSLFVAAALYVILSHSYDAKDKQWAYGTAGTILGYWLKK
jgi:hypothetical protein